MTLQIKNLTWEDTSILGGQYLKLLKWRPFGISTRFDVFKILIALLIDIRLKFLLLLQLHRSTKLDFPKWF